MVILQSYILFTNTVQKDKIPYDIRAEVLFREAEDCFYYFYKSKAALKKLDLALQYYPYHFKSLMLKGDILFSEGNYDEALKLYAKATEVRNNNPRLYASVANCLNELHFYHDARLFCDKALNLIQNCDDDFFSSVYELKIKIEMNLRHFDEVRNLLNLHIVKEHENLSVLKHILSKTLENKTELRKRLQKLHLRAI